MDLIPKWLNDNFLEKALNTRGINKYKVISINVTRATAPGDNYGSDIYRAVMKVKNDGKEDSVSVIIKAELEKNELSKFFAESNAFQKEIDAFTIILPALDELLEEALPDKPEPYAAKCYYTHSGFPASVLVLEDLKVRGFRIADKATELDLNHCLLVARRLATYQAASAVLFKLHPDKIKPFKATMFSESMRPAIEKMIQPVIKSLAEEAKNWPECKDYIANKLRELAPVSYNCLMECVKTDDEVFNVLAHEDVWINNLMFHYSDVTNEVTDIRLVDLQLYHWTSPAVDLLYFINANATTEIVENQEIVIDEYYKTLNETLTTLKYPHLCPSKEHLYNQINKRCKFGVIMGLIIRSYIFSDPEKIPDIEKVVYGEGQIHLSQAYKKSMRKILPIFQRKGWL